MAQPWHTTAMRAILSTVLGAGAFRAPWRARHLLRNERPSAGIATLRVSMREAGERLRPIPLVLMAVSTRTAVLHDVGSRVVATARRGRFPRP